MFKKLSYAIIGAFIAASACYADTNVGIKPTPGSGPSLVDGTWLNGVVGGSNWKNQYAISAAGTTQAGATQLPANTYLLEVDTAGSGGNQGVALPTCLGGTEIVVINNTAYTFYVYPSVTNNPVTSAQDTINNSTSTTITTYALKKFACGKTGVWIAN
jgi:hypothetical protein